MKLTDIEKKEMLEDGLSVERRDMFRRAPRPQPPATFEDYIALLDDLTALAPHPPRPPIVRYKNVKL
jgi:hypothetical protein